MAFEIPETDVWVSYDADFVKRVYAESVQNIFGSHGMYLSDEEAQDILDSLNETICDAMSNAGFEIIENEYWKRRNG